MSITCTPKATKVETKPRTKTPMLLSYIAMGSAIEVASGPPLRHFNTCTKLNRTFITVHTRYFGVTVFTGIIEEIGHIVEAVPSHLLVTGSIVVEDLKLGDSIAINGICLTVVKINEENFSLDIVPETLQRTNLGRLKTLDSVNLERAVAYGARMGGHMVQGHGEGTGEILGVKPDGTASIMEVSAPVHLMPYLVEKGFVAVDGASLTVVSVGKKSFSLSLIPYTLEHTTLGSREPGDVVNLETDIVARYVERLSQGQRGS